MPLSGQKILERRLQRRLSQAEAARRAGITQALWSWIETGRRPDPALSTAERIAAALGCQVQRLIDEDH